MENSDYLLTDKEKRSGFLGLYFGRMVMAISTGLLGVFLPIFLYTIFKGNMSLVMGYYAVATVVYLFLVAFGAQFLNRFGFRKALVLASLSAVVINTAYFFTTPENMWKLLPISILFLIIFRVLFWIPYHVDFAIFTNTGKRGGQVGLMLSTITLLGVVGPMVAGYIIEAWTMQALFFIAIIIYTLGAIPFATVPRTNEKFSWNYVRTWRELFSKKNRAVVWASIAMGTEETIGVIIWPIFIFLLLQGDYFKVGALSSFIVGVTVLLQYMFGHYLDHLEKIGKKHHLLKIGSILYALGWIVKIFVVTAFHVFVIGLYHKIAKVVTDTSYDAIFYELAADQGHYVDEFTVLSEMAVQIGRLIALGAVAVMVMFIGLNWTFVIGALASLALTSLSIVMKEEKRA
ncbi:MAG: MFS transporter [bacterium]|nr:MFS transporter [bacterium]